MAAQRNTQQDSDNAAGSQAPEQSEQLQDLAFKLFSQRTSQASVRNRNVERVVLDCFRDAEVFITTTQKIRRGGLKEQLNESVLNEACAPNLKRTHPLNLVSQHYAPENGGEKRVLGLIREVLRYIETHPQAEAIDEVAGLRLDWEVPEIRTAVLIFPHYVKAAGQEAAATAG